MGPLADELKRLSAAEDFFRFFGVDYDRRRVDVYRLHILRRFGQLLGEVDWSGLDRAEVEESYRLCLQIAHAEAPRSGGLPGAGGKGFIALADIGGRT